MGRVVRCAESKRLYRPCRQTYLSALRIVVARPFVGRQALHRPRCQKRCRAGPVRSRFPRPAEACRVAARAARLGFRRSAAHPVRASVRGRVLCHHRCGSLFRARYRRADCRRSRPIERRVVVIAHPDTPVNVISGEPDEPRIPLRDWVVPVLPAIWTPLQRPPRLPGAFAPRSPGSSYRPRSCPAAPSRDHPLANSTARERQERLVIALGGCKDDRGHRAPLRIHHSGCPHRPRHLEQRAFADTPRARAGPIGKVTFDAKLARHLTHQHRAPRLVPTL